MWCLRPSGASAGVVKCSLANAHTTATALPAHRSVRRHAASISACSSMRRTQTLQIQVYQSTKHRPPHSDNKTWTFTLKVNADVQKEGFAEHVKRSLIERGILRADVQIDNIKQHLTGKAYSVDSMVTVKILRVETAVYKNRYNNVAGRFSGEPIRFLPSQSG